MLVLCVFCGEGGRARIFCTFFVLRANEKTNKREGGFIMKHKKTICTQQHKHNFEWREK